MSLNPDTCSVLLDPASASMISSSTSTTAFLADEEASTCPLLLSATPSPPPLDYVDPPSRVQAEEDASTCPLLLSATPSPPPLDYVDPPDGKTDNPCSEEGVEQGCCVQNTEEEENEGMGNEETSSSDGTEPAQALFGGMREYQHLGFTHQQDVCSGKPPLPTSGSDPCFASWNWPVIRAFAFWLCTLSVVACGVAVGYTLATLPKSCDPKTTWYRGGVFYEASPLVFSDSDGDGIGDLKGIASRSDYLKTLGISALHLNNIFPSRHKGDIFIPVATILELDEALGTPEDFIYLAEVLHSRNISLVLDLPVYPYVKKLQPVHKLKSADEDQQAKLLSANKYNDTEDSKHNFDDNVLQGTDDEIGRAIKLWSDRGADGFYLLGIENLADDENLLDSLAGWKSILGEEKILIVKKELLDNLDNDGEIDSVLASADLIDVRLTAWNDSADLGSQIERSLSGPLSPERGAWIHWTLGYGHSNFISEENLPYVPTSSLPHNATLATTLMQMMLPGTTSIHHGDEIALQKNEDSERDLLVNSVDRFSTEQIAAMIRLRLTTPVIYKNSIRKQDIVSSNFAVRSSADNLLVLERWYPRRNSIASITNMSPASVTLDLSSMFYSGMRMLYPHNNEHLSQTSEEYEKIYFKSLHLHPHETLVVRLDK